MDAFDVLRRLKDFSRDVRLRALATLQQLEVGTTTSGDACAARWRRGRDALRFRRFGARKLTRDAVQDEAGETSATRWRRGRKARGLRLAGAHGGIGYAGRARGGDAREARRRRGREARGFQWGTCAWQLLRRWKSYSRRHSALAQHAVAVHENNVTNIQQNLKNKDYKSIVSLYGVVIDINEIIETPTSSRQTSTSRGIDLGDDSDTGVTCAIWGEYIPTRTTLWNNENFNATIERCVNDNVASPK